MKKLNFIILYLNFLTLYNLNFKIYLNIFKKKYITLEYGYKQTTKEALEESQKGSQEEVCRSLDQKSLV